MQWPVGPGSTSTLRATSFRRSRLAQQTGNMIRPLSYSNKLNQPDNRITGDRCNLAANLDNSDNSPLKTDIDVILLPTQTIIRMPLPECEVVECIGSMQTATKLLLPDLVRANVGA